MSSAFLLETNFAMNVAFCLAEKEDVRIVDPFKSSHQSYDRAKEANFAQSSIVT